jgi:transcriptional regulator with GAF, ATPase, and Fis domain
MDIRDFFREVTVRVAGHLDVEQALRDLFVFLRQHMPCDLIEVNYLEEETREVRRLAWVEERGGEVVSQRSRTLFTLPEAAMASVLRFADEHARGGVELIPVGDLSRLPPQRAFRQTFRHLNRYQVASVTLRIEGRLVGVLILGVRPPAKLTEREAELLGSVIEPLAIAFSNARRYEELLRLKECLDEDNRALSLELHEESGHTAVIGADSGLRGVMQMIRRVAPLGSPVLLLGETGTGKEVLAHTIHRLSPRAEKPFVRVQCGAIPETLLDSELFGHEQGAFTGALTAKRGRFERADGGTLFLDEIGELSPDAQVKLLRVLQDKEFERLGGSETLHVDVRVIAATHRDLPAMIGEGRFREDLWFRLNVFPLSIPPLRDRPQDIPALFNHFMTKKCRQLNLRLPVHPSEDMLAELEAYDWPGNVRELENVVERALITSRKGRLRLPPLVSPPNHHQAAQSEPAAEITTLDEAMAEHIRQAMRRARGRIQGSGGAAELLGIEPNTLRARMRKLGIPFGRNATRWDESGG